ncbi:DUF1152 domain-containing protein [Streptomyces silvensis]|uniref:DUF1152 domain-containing protein n=1 Tax=Streptomyces silvensis TaxID=1765722 RepID=UPI000AA7CCB2|nr:DUF1152 domain-containing protein [Streptomyces silvensis]
MKRLIVAAGGGGDAVAAAMLHAALYRDDRSPALILTYSWDRLLIDPAPGPRSSADFVGLRELTPHVRAVPGTAALKSSHAATLPRLAAELPHTFALIDPYAGATGVTTQMDALTRHFAPESIDLLDVGGDILAHGDEPTLRSPLADALTLAACARAESGRRVRLLVAGPGLDGELPADTLRTRLGARVATFTPADAAEVAPVLRWHPSEATALLAATAAGARGLCEVRDAGLLVPMTAEGPTVHEVDLSSAFAANRLAQALADTTSLTEAEEHCRHVCGTSEIDDERAKARRRSVREREGGKFIPDVELTARVSEFASRALARGATHATVRRLTEALRLSEGARQRLVELLAEEDSGLPPSVRALGMWAK